MISKGIVDFLKALEKNNNREWFQQNRDWYEKAKTEFELFVNSLLHELRLIDPGLSLISAKDCIFRIYRDVRFSKDKTPYRYHLAFSIGPGGRQLTEPGYYVHFEPGNNFIAGGIYRPEPEKLAAIRQEIDYNEKEFLDSLAERLETRDFNEEKIVSDEIISIAKEDFGVEISVFAEDDSDIYDPKGKARHARSFKPAILIE